MYMENGSALFESSAPKSLIATSAKFSPPGSSSPFPSPRQACTMDDDGQGAADGWGCVENGSQEEDIHGFPGLLNAAGLSWACNQVPGKATDIQFSHPSRFFSACSQRFSLPTRLPMGCSPILSSTETRAISWPRALNLQSLVQSEAQSQWKAC